MSETNYNKFKESLARLEERYSYYLKNKNNVLFDSEIQESIKESCIQRFEVCFDTTHKHLKKYLEDEGYSNVPDSPKQKFRLASQNNLFDAELWIEFNKKRGDTSHDYCGDKADGTFEIIPDFIKEAISLYEIMSGVKWRN